MRLQHCALPTLVSYTTDMKSQLSPLVDTFDRRIRYLRLSVTDRCDFRCQYCMTEEMRFLPRKAVLSEDEIIRLASLFVDLGVEKIRLTGGEPLIRPDIVAIARRLHKIDGLKELVLTTNGSQLTTLAKPLVDAGVSRINVSLDTLCETQFSELSRTGNLDKVLKGIDAAIEAETELVSGGGGAGGGNGSSPEASFHAKGASPPSQPPPRWTAARRSPMGRVSSGLTHCSRLASTRSVRCACMGRHHIVTRRHVDMDVGQPRCMPTRPHAHTRCASRLSPLRLSGRGEGRRRAGPPPAANWPRAGPGCEWYRLTRA